MARTARQTSETNIYHVTARGSGLMRTFEDDHDRQRFIDKLAETADAYTMTLYAWCLMGNHVHLLTKAALGDLSAGMKRLLSGYAAYFNLRHGRVGPVFQGRFGSEPIESDEHFLAAVRYVHRNPENAGIAPAASYQWSSYGEYVGTAALCDTMLALDMLGGEDAFVRFHDTDGNSLFSFADVHEPRARMDDEAAAALVRKTLGKDVLDRASSAERAERNALLARMKELGLSLRQIQRLTGVGYNIISRAE